MLLLTTTDLICSSWGSELVTIYVGEGQKECEVHKKLICNKSSYFVKLFNRPFKEGETQATNDPEATSQAFDLFLSWLYTGQQPFLSSVAAITGCADSGKHEELLIELYILADR